MKLILHELVHSPFCIPVRRILEGYGVEHACIEVPNWDRRSLAVLTNGAYYQVPVIEWDDRVVFETAEDPLAVAHFLDTSFAGGRLFPGHCAGVHEILIGHIENSLEGPAFQLSDPAYVDGIADLGERTMLIRHKERKFGPGCVERWRAHTAELLASFESCLAPYETPLGRSAFLFGEAPVYADFALFGVLGNFQFGGHHRLGDRFVNLHRWLRDLEAWRAG